MGRDCELMSPPLRSPVVKALTYTDKMRGTDSHKLLDSCRDKVETASIYNDLQGF
jgi:hypothetical protein